MFMIKQAEIDKTCKQVLLLVIVESWTSNMQAPNVEKRQSKHHTSKIWPGEHGNYFQMLDIIDREPEQLWMKLKVTTEEESKEIPGKNE